jgi:hypothetical protein
VREERSRVAVIAQAKEKEIKGRDNPLSKKLSQIGFVALSNLFSDRIFG